MWIWNDESMFDCMMHVVSSSLPVLLYVCDVCGYSYCDDHQLGLMGADGRVPRGQQGSGDPVA